MKRLLLVLLSLLILLSSAGCSSHEPVQLAATTLPVYEFTHRLCDGTELRVGRLVTESISCLHDYSLQVSQMQMIEDADCVIISGGGLEDSLGNILTGCDIIDPSKEMSLLCPEHGHEEPHQGHHHETDPHYWLSPNYAKTMAKNICQGLCLRYPQHTSIFEENLTALLEDLNHLQAYGEDALSKLSKRQLITFHDGFSYFAQSFGLTILESVEEESGSEASAAEIIHLLDMIEAHSLPAIFIEENGSDACAGIIQSEIGIPIYTLDMAISGNSYFDAMYRNIDTIKEALG